MPAMIVWPVSGSVRTRKVGSSSASFCSAMASLSWSALVFGSIATSITGFGNFIASRMIGLSLVAQRVAGARVLEPDRRARCRRRSTSSISSRLLACICSSRPDALALVLGRVVDVAAGFEHARVHAEEGQPADERVGRDLERQRRERLVVADGARSNVVVVARQVPLDRRDVHRRRQVVDHRVEQRLHALVLERGAAEHRHECIADRRLADGAAGSRRS